MRPRWRGLVALGLVLSMVGLLWLVRPTGTRAEPSLRGRVEGPRDLGGVRVRIKGTPHTTLTDAQGWFELPHVSGAERVTASKEGFLIAGAPLDALSLRLLPLPKADHPEYQWVDPARGPEGEHRCANCHSHIYEEWQSSAHSRSANGRHFLDLYTGKGGGWGLLKDHPLGAGVCASCHAPTVGFGEEAFLDLTRASGVSAKGVHCDYCHKIRGPAEGDIGLTHGRYGLDLLRPEEGQLFFGPLDDVDRGEDAYSPFYRESRYCASCHEGIVFGVPVYETYSEWLKSPARRQGVQCQDCHMTPTGKLTNIAPGRGGIERDPSTLANHTFWNGSQAAMLRRALKAEVTLTRGDITEVAVTLEAKGVGHRIPTGLPDRHLILMIEGTDVEGNPVKTLPGEPRLSDLAGAHKGKAGRLFAKVLQARDGTVPAPFWSARTDPLRDDRLHPEERRRFKWRFPKELKTVRLRLIHRRFWQSVAEVKDWPTPGEIVIMDRNYVVNEN